MPSIAEGPGCTPSVDGEHLYVIGMGGRLACLQTADGKIVWQKSLAEDFGGIVPPWSYRESPLVDGDLVICTPGAADALVVALDKHTGDVVWKTARPAAPAQAPRREGSEPRIGTPPQGRPAGGIPPPAPQQIAGTDEPQLFISEHWGMNGFAVEVPNGRYNARLYFAETYQGITAPGQRVFSFTVGDTEFKDFDIWVKAGGPRKAYIEKVPVEVTDGAFRVSFTQQVENPAIKAIELVPDGNSEQEAVRINAGASADFTDSKGHIWKGDRGFEGGSTNPGTFTFGPPGGGGRGFGGFGGERPGAGYASVIALEAAGRRQYVQFTATALIGVDAGTGKLLWQYTAPANPMGITCSTPIAQDGLVFAASAYGTGGGAVKLTAAEDGTIHAEEVYFSPRMQNHHGGMIVVDGALYGAHGGNEGGFLSCLDFQTGEVLWRDRDGPKGAVAMADGRLYLRAEDGELLLIEPSREGILIRGRFPQPDRRTPPAWAHPVIANGKLYVRDQDLLLCYDIAQPR